MKAYMGLALWFWVSAEILGYLVARKTNIFVLKIEEKRRG